MSAAEAFRAEAAKRILIKDGAYGTLIQAERLQSADYCGGLDLMKDQRGNNDLLNLTRPELVARRSARASPMPAPTSSPPTPSTPIAISQADYGAEALVADINRAAAQIIREVADRYTREGRQAALGRGRARPDQQDAVAVARRQRSRLSAKSTSTR